MAASLADGPAPWEPVITRPDPMTAEEWEACLERDLAEDQDPEELQYEDDFLNPDADLTGAELAEIAAAMQERAADVAVVAGTAGADPAGVAAVLTTSTTPPTKQADEPAYATRILNVGTTTRSNSTPGGWSTSSPTEPSDGPPRLDASTAPSRRGTRYDRRRREAGGESHEPAVVM